MISGIKLNGMNYKYSFTTSVGNNSILSQNKNQNSNKLTNTTVNVNSRKLNTIVIDYNVTELSLRNKNVKTESVCDKVEKYHCLKALDLSYNKIESFPRGLPQTLIAINLSYNFIPSLKSFKCSCYLVELHLRGNEITR